eukprot:5203876-Alexandrium_andersonii.AAC.1
MVTYRAPGVNHLPGPRPDPAKFVELDLLLAQDRWKSAVRKVESDCHCPLSSDHFPVVVELA